MLRGPQTPGELKQRTERLFAFHDLAAIHTTLDALISRELVERLQRRPGQKEERYRQLLGGEIDESEAAATGPGDSADPGISPAEAAAHRPAPAAEPLPVPVDTPETERIEKLEREVGELRAELNDLRDQLGA